MKIKNIEYYDYYYDKKEVMIDGKKGELLGIIDFENKIVLNEKEHKYYYDGIEIKNQISATTLIKNLGDIKSYSGIANSIIKKDTELDIKIKEKATAFLKIIDKKMDEFFDKRMDRGTKIHSLIENKKIPQIEKLLDHICKEDYIEDFKTTNTVVKEFRELKILFKIDETYTVVGTVDYGKFIFKLIGKNNIVIDSFNLIDFKVSNNIGLYKPSGFLQTSIYRDAIMNIHKGVFSSNPECNTTHIILINMKDKENDLIKDKNKKLKKPKELLKPTYSVLNYDFKDFGNFFCKNFGLYGWRPPSKENGFTQPYEEFDVDIDNLDKEKN